MQNYPRCAGVKSPRNPAPAGSGRRVGGNPFRDPQLDALLDETHYNKLIA